MTDSSEEKTVPPELRAWAEGPGRTYRPYPQCWDSADLLKKIDAATGSIRTELIEWLKQLAAEPILPSNQFIREHLVYFGSGAYIVGLTYNQCIALIEHSKNHDIPWTDLGKPPISEEEITKLKQQGISVEHRLTVFLGNGNDAHSPLFTSLGIEPVQPISIS